MSDDGWTWELSSTAEDDLDGLSSTDQDRILDKLDEIVSSPWRDPPDYGEPLQNSPYKKIRVGEFGGVQIRMKSEAERFVSGSCSKSPASTLVATASS
ncbi:type II toxin-antitoxin system RelE family toxin [Halolamina sp. C58]|uniref:type II toxin-antitoxin system RelE family toxin n=1 Tax=Halolamina sp. C58 TaxID=3421640 RepID=UPI003EC1003C